MATYDVTQGMRFSPRVEEGITTRIHNRVDFSKLNAAQNDVFQVFYFPIKTHIHRIAAIVETAGDSGTTVQVGRTGGDVDEFIASIDLNATAGTIYWTGSNSEDMAATNGLALTVADTIDALIVGGAAANAVVSFYADVSKYPEKTTALTNPVKGTAL